MGKSVLFIFCMIFVFLKIYWFLLVFAIFLLILLVHLISTAIFILFSSALHCLCMLPFLLYYNITLYCGKEINGSNFVTYIFAQHLITTLGSSSESDGEGGEGICILKEKINNNFGKFLIVHQVLVLS